MAMDVFKNPSTFTWIGRHASEFRFLVDSLYRSPEKVLDIGKGPFKPIYFSEMLPTYCELVAVDTPEMCGLINRLEYGREELSLPDFATVVCNKDDNGKPIPNTDLTDPVLLEVAASELRLAGLEPSDYLDIGRKTFRSPSKGVGVTLMAELEDLDTYLGENVEGFDLVYLGLVLLNVGKVSGRDELVRLSRSLIESVKPDGVLGVGEHPRALYGSKSIPAVVEEAGGILTDAFVDNLVAARGNLRGGHCLRFVKQDKYSPILRSVIDQRIADDELLRQLGIDYRQVDGDRIGPYLSAQDEVKTDSLLVAALRRNGGYDVWEAPMAKVMEVTPPTRKTLSLIPGLGYMQGQ